MRMERIEPQRSWSEAMIVRLFRRWVAARQEGVGTAASLVALAGELNVPPLAAVALDSLLALTESCLGRRLEAECCCSKVLAPDERAVLLLLGAAGQARHPVFASPAVPHGLPGAVAWAAASLVRLLDHEVPPAPAPSRCPFASSAV